MTGRVIRTAQPDDASSVLALYPRAFPEEDLTGLVADLLPSDEVLSLVVQTHDSVIAHAAFTRCSNTLGTAKLALLGPIAVHPDHQRDGVGGALIEDGAARLAREGVSELLVLGDPEYYRHRGFDAPATVQPPYPLKEEWAEAWRSRLLSGATRSSGTLTVPAPWRSPELWG